MKELGIAMHFRSQMITIDEITLPMIALTICKLLAHSSCKAEYSLANEPISTHAKRASQMLDTKDNKKSVSSQMSKTIASF
jgi:hypothetical protein